MRPIVVVKTGSTMPALREARGDYEDWIADGMGRGGVKVCDVAAGDTLPDPATIRAVAITGSAAMVTDRLEWSERAARWLPEVIARGTPVLGICYGHQLMAHALGGEVGPSPNGREIGIVEVTLSDEATRDPLLGGLGPTLRVSQSHRQVVLEMPKGARLLASNAHERHQAFAIGERAWGVQFHPEWDHEVVRAYLVERAPILREEGLDPDALIAAAAPSPHGAAILRRFGELV
jgi:GMP synthase (glutamine-hydrolysing)